MKTINKYLYNIFTAISISIILRIALINTYGDTLLENEWGNLFYNLKNNGVLAYREFEGRLIPSVYMPPLYVYFIYLIDFFLPSESYLVKTILILQIIISSLSILIFYKINLLFFSKKISFFSTYLFVFFPLHVYSSLQVSSITLQIFLNLIFLYLILKILNQNKKPIIFLILGFISGLTILLRGEFILILFLTIIFLIIKNKINFKNLILTILMTILISSPYLIRNYIIFVFFSITKSFGYNLWKGNNIDSTVEGSESANAFETGSIKTKINNLSKDNLYDFNYDKIFLEQSKKFIYDDPILFFIRYIKKFLSFTFFNLNSNYKDYYHPLNIYPLLFLSILFPLGIVFSHSKKSLGHNYLILNLFFTIAVFSFFFILPRYKLIILPIQLIIVNIFVEKCISYYFKKKGV